MKNRKSILVLIIFAIAYIGLLVYANTGWNGYTITNTTGVEYETAKVLKILADNAVKDETIENHRKGSMEMLVRVTSGRYKGEEVQITNYLSAMYNVDCKAGDTITVRIDTKGDSHQVAVYNHYRTPYLLAFVAIFALVLIVVGGKQGVKALAGLIFTFVSIVYLLVPLTLRGVPSVPLTVAIVGVTTAVSFYLLGGWQPKTVGAALGCVFGVCCAALLGAAAIYFVKISAYQMEEAEALILAQNEYGIHLSGLFLSGVLLASLGAVMDIAMSIASSMDELKQKKADISQKELFMSGMRVGRDASGTMANTLVLALAGSSLNMMILIYSYQVSFVQLMNTDFVAIELIRAIAGSLGIVLAVPFVAMITARLLTKPQKEASAKGKSKK